MTSNASGKLQLTIVDGTTLTGLYAADGSYNCVLTTESTTIKGLHHPCGGYWGTVGTNLSAPYNAPDGSMNIVQNADLSYSPLYP